MYISRDQCFDELRGCHRYINSLSFREQLNLSEQRIRQIETLAARPDVYEALSRALAPSIYEQDDIKKGVLLQLLGGSKKDFSKLGRGRPR